MSRLTWNEYFQKITEDTALRSSSAKLKVGAVIVKDNRIISTGYNGFLAGVEHNPITDEDGHEINTVHAEMNAICDSAKRGVQINDASIYITHFPCIHCIKAILASGIKTIYYTSDYNNNELVYLLIEQTGGKATIVKL